MRAPAGQRTARGAVALSVLVVVAFAAGRFGVTAVTLLLALVVAGEQFRLARSAGARPVAAVGLLTVAALIVAAHADGEHSPRWLPPIAAGGLALAFVAMLRRSVRTNVTRSLIATVLPVVTAGVLGAFVPALRALAGPRGTWGFLLLVIGASAGAALATRGRSAQISAFAGAAFGALVVAAGLAVAWSPEYEAGRAILLALVIAVCVPLGPVLAARIEADLQGGEAQRSAVALRRVAGALLAAPVFFYVFRALTT